MSLAFDVVPPLGRTGNKCVQVCMAAHKHSEWASELLQHNFLQLFVIFLSPCFPRLSHGFTFFESTLTGHFFLLDKRLIQCSLVNSAISHEHNPQQLAYSSSDLVILTLCYHPNFLQVNKAWLVYYCARYWYYKEKSIPNLLPWRWLYSRKVEKSSFNPPHAGQCGANMQSQHSGGSKVQGWPGPHKMTGFEEQRNNSEVHSSW